MAVPQPLIKVNDALRINLFNVTSVTTEIQTLGTAAGEQVVVIQLSGGTRATLQGEDADKFLQYFDNFADDMHTALLSQPHQASPREPSESATGRDFAELVDQNRTEPPNG